MFDDTTTITTNIINNSNINNKTPTKKEEIINKTILEEDDEIGSSSSSSTFTGTATTTMNLNNMQIKNSDEEKKEVIIEKTNEKNEQQQQHQHESNLNIIQTKHKEFQVVIVSDDILKQTTTATITPAQDQQQTNINTDETNNNNNNDNNNNDEKLEPLETLPVEEGYATRKMDEYFRQTIAAIKQELTKKLEESHPDDDDHHIHHHHHHHHFNNQVTNNNNINACDLNDLTELTAKDLDLNTNISQNSNDIALMKSSLNCVDCFLNGHCLLHQTSTTNGTNNNNNNNNLNTSILATNIITTTTTTPSCNNNRNTSRNANFSNIINWLLILASILNHILIDGFLFNYSNLFFYIQNAYSSSANYSIMMINNNDNSHNNFMLPTIINNSASSLHSPTASVSITTITAATSPVVVLSSSSSSSSSRYLNILYTLPGSFLIGIYLLFIPISLFISKRFGIRIVAIIGSLISALSILAASFMKLNVGLFILFYSILNGIGISLIYIPSVLIISEWPYRKRLFSNTLVLCGTSIGICIYPIICEFLLEIFDFFDTIFILSAIQLNLLVGTLILISYKDYYGNNHAKLARQCSNGHTNGHIHQPTYQQQQQQHHLHSSKIKDHYNDDESTNSQSIDNFTLKQHWRRFCQTRKSNLKTRKNLFHLIAEEKRKSRALSKGSLEDGFVITTSNNLLAPDDPNVVLLSRRGQSSTSNAHHNGSQHSGGGASSGSHKPNLLTRIAHSLRSLTHHGSSSLHDKHHGTGGGNVSSNSHSHHHQQHTSSSHHHHSNSSSSHHHPHHHPHHHTTQLQNQPISEQSDNERLLSDTSANATTSSTASGTSPSPLIINEKPVNLELINIFTKPVDLMEKIEETQVPTKVHQESNQQQQQETPQIDENNNNVTNKPKDNSHMLDLFHLRNYDDNSSSSSDSNHSDDGSHSDEEYSPSGTPMRLHYMDTGLNEEAAASSSFFSSSSAKSSRYMSYRNSLTNSVRGSLIECSVREEDDDGEHERVNQNSKSSRSHHHHHHNGHHYRHGHYSNNHHHHRKIHTNSNNHHHRLHTTPNTTVINNVNSVTSKIAYYNERLRKLNTLSIIDTSSFLNLPINSKTLYFNLNNSFIKKRKKQNSITSNNNNNNANVNVNSNNAANSKTVSFVNYMKYLFDKNLFLNSLIFLTNLTFSLSLLGLITPVFFLIQYLKSRDISKDYCIYILATVGLASAIGRIISTVVYKSNNENAKNRIFAYNLSTIFIGLVTFASTFCGSLFTFALFAMGYGGLLGFNLCLRSVFLYDMVGLDWNDDSLFSVLAFGQGLAITIGLPVAGLIADIWESYTHVYYFSCILLIVSGVLTIIGSKLIEFFICTHKSFNKSYLKKRS